VATFSLVGLGLPSDLTLGRIAVVQGSAEGLTVRDGEIRFITPEDPGEETEVVLRLALDDSDVFLPVRIESARPAAIVLEVEPDEQGNLPAAGPVLKVQGLGPGNLLQPSALAFSVDGASELDPGASSATLFVPQSSQIIDLAKYWTLHKDSNQLRIVQTDVAELRDKVPSGDLVLDVGLSSVDGELGAAWTIAAYKGTAQLTGLVVDARNAPVTNLAGRKIAIRGLNTNRTRRVATIDANGAFSSAYLSSGAYELALLDTEAPNSWTASFAILVGSSQVTVKLPYEAPETSGQKAATLRSLAVLARAGEPRLPMKVGREGVANQGRPWSWRAVSRTGPMQRSS